MTATAPVEPVEADLASAGSGPEEGDGFARPLTAEDIAAGQRMIFERDRVQVDLLQSRIPEPQNHGYVQALTQVATLSFGSRRFRVPPIPYPAGVQLQHVMQRLHKLESADAADLAVVEALLDTYEEAVAVFWHLVEPASFLGRLVASWRWRDHRWGLALWRRLRHNPFHTCTEHEIGVLLGFFFVCRMRSRVRLPTSSSTPAAPSPPATSPTRPPSSRGLSRRGWVRTATR